MLIADLGLCLELAASPRNTSRLDEHAIHAMHAYMPPLFNFDFLELIFIVRM